MRIHRVYVYMYTAPTSASSACEPVIGPQSACEPVIGPQSGAVLEMAFPPIVASKCSIATQNSATNNATM